MTKRSIPPLGNTSVCLRLLTKADLPQTLEWRNLDHIRIWFFHSDIISLENHLAWFEKYKEKDDDFVFIIIDTQTNHAVGQIALYHIDWKQKRAEYGRLIIGAPEARGKGFAKIATRLLVAYAFENLGLEEIYLEVLEGNLAARKVYEQCGFTITHHEKNVIALAIRKN
jgi:UDP-4-amino-4,6-dideoxy-N-acetyl-beta-L-altrosamine N-acetyltransferase